MAAGQRRLKAGSGKAHALKGSVLESGRQSFTGKGRQNPFRNAAKPESSGDTLQNIAARHKALLTLAEEFGR